MYIIHMELKIRSSELTRIIHKLFLLTEKREGSEKNYFKIVVRLSRRIHYRVQFEASEPISQEIVAFRQNDTW